MKKNNESISEAIGIEFKPETLPVKIEPAPVSVSNEENLQDQEATHHFYLRVLLLK